MARVVLRKLRKVFAGKARAAVEGCDLEIDAGELLTLWGPAGSGKSTLLRMVAGLEPITAGEVLLDGQVANLFAPRERGIAMVFQNYALYPHITIYENLALGLTMERMEKAEQDARVREAAQRLGMSDLLERKPGALSAGQRHRVAIARAIARRPGVYIFDAPFGNLEQGARAQLLTEIGKLQAELGATMIYATQDPGESVALGSRGVEMRDGELVPA